jgi:hypothetical protein
VTLRSISLPFGCNLGAAFLRSSKLLGGFIFSALLFGPGFSNSTNLRWPFEFRLQTGIGFRSNYRFGLTQSPTQWTAECADAHH